MSEPIVIPKKEKKPRQFDPAVFLETAAKGRTISTHRKNEVIFSQGSVADAAFYIKKGKVKVTVISKQGKEAVVAIMGVDEFVGEGCLIGQIKYLATASAMTECVTIRVAKAEIQQVLRDEPAFSQMFMSHILTRNARVEEISSSTQRKNVSPGCCCS
jgi:CRP/FNR family cyclic AMP-dependent transcriptional regulator